MTQERNGHARRAGTLASLLCAAFCAAVIAALGGCEKPKEEECKKAIANIQHIYGTAGIKFGASPDAMIRSCRGSTSAASVKCFSEAQTLEDLQRCEGAAFDEMFGEAAGTEGTAAPEGAAPTPDTPPQTTP